MKKLIALAIIGLAWVSCKKDTKNTTPEPTPQPSVVDTSNAAVTFTAYVGTSPLVYGTNYTNAHGDTFKVSKFTYFISNVELTKDDNTVFKEAKSYHLINHSTSGNKTFTITGIPAGNYKSISYIIGVDSARNVSGVQEGDLRPSLGMFWDWNTGYIMLKFEGTSPQAINSMQDITYHIGGFSYPYSCLKKVNITFPQNLVVKKDVYPKLKLKVDLSEMFKNPQTIDFANTYYIMTPGIETNGMSENYKDMFSFESITP